MASRRRCATAARFRSCPRSRGASTLDRPIRVFHADDSAPYRMLVRELLAGDEALAVVGEAGTADEAVDGIARLRPDVVLLDRLGDPGLVGRVRAAAPGVRIVVLSGHAGLPDAGVDAVVVKSPFVDELRATVLRVAER